ncbi:MAG: phosphoribosylamine--glycine ligase [Flavobacteriaceae bacterium]|nr:phosphoribosylamine--glycine ligase [Flavobacteriaceae bacterium]
MKVLIVGNGGRESAIAWKLKQDDRITQFYFAKGNASTEKLGTTVYENSIEDLVKFAKKEDIDLTILGPEAPLVEGIVDEFQKEGLRIFGAKKVAALLEGSKAYSKKFMQEYGVKTAKAEIFESYNEAIEYVKNHTFPLVIKASGLASGKGVVICNDLEEAETTIHDFMIRKIYGDAGIRIVVEEFLQGFEASVIAFSNGEKFFPCISVKDYKKLGNNDQGPNTGGMGTVAPNPHFTAEHMEKFIKDIMNPTMKGIQDNMLKFKGFIFFGLMVSNDECYLLEYNMRLGDPETQVIIPLLENNLLDTINDCIDGKEIELKFADQKAVCLVIASGGYPRDFEKGLVIENLDKVKNSEVFFAGATYEGDKIITTGGRVLNLVATGKTYEEARQKVYEDAPVINFDYAYYRQDIGLTK